MLLCGQSSHHRFANQEALKEIRRVLKPGGKLAMIWNIEDCRSSPPHPLLSLVISPSPRSPPDNKPRAWKAATAWEQQLHELIINAATDGQPRFRDDVWWQVFDEQDKEKPLFTTPIGEDKDVEWNIWLSKDALWDRVHTLSHVSMLQGEARERFRAEFDRILEEGDGRWNDKKEVLVHGISPTAWTTRL
jgi:SAM-dependent methyltransferase